MTRYEYLYSLCRYMQLYLPPTAPPGPVYIRRSEMPRFTCADCSLITQGRKSQYLIRIKKTYDEDHALDVFIHEYAHALSWEKESHEHGIVWGRAYSRVYRIYLKWLLSDGFKRIKKLYPEDD